jgi:hypothetical protein
MDIDMPSADAWWQALTPEVRRFWIIRITGWTMTGVIAEAYARATCEPPRLEREGWP